MLLVGSEGRFFLRFVRYNLPSYFKPIKWCFLFYWICKSHISNMRVAQMMSKCMKKELVTVFPCLTCLFVRRWLRVLAYIVLVMLVVVPFHVNEEMDMLEWLANQRAQMQIHLKSLVLSSKDILNVSVKRNTISTMEKTKKKKEKTTPTTITATTKTEH